MGSNGFLEKYGAGAQSPAGPSGLRQSSEAGASYVPGADDNSFLAKYTAENGLTQNNMSWFTGANYEGVENGWDNDFTNDFMAQWDKAVGNGTAADYFGQANATGVAFWDHTTSKGQEVKFGDIYQNGKRVGNLYDQFKAEPGVADQMMAQFILTPEQQREAFAHSDREKALSDLVQGERTARNSTFEDTMQAIQFQSGVTETAMDWQAGSTDELIAGGGGAAGGAALGAGIGAGIGATAGGIGAAPGALIGAGIGALTGLAGGLMNKDDLTMQAARAYEITSLSRDAHGDAAGAATGLYQWSAFGGKLISPTGNLVKGSFDIAEGEVGDIAEDGTGVSFYDTDEDGERLAGAGWRALDVGAAVVDGGLQFASPLGAAVYTTQIGGVVVGQVAELSLTGGETFNYSSGQFESIFTDDEGNFDAARAGAGLAKIGIDAVQMGFGRGLASKIDNAAIAVGGKAPGYSLTSKLADPVKQKLPQWMGGTKGLAEGHSLVKQGMHTYTVDATGKAVARRKNMQMFVPSEQLNAASTRVMAVRNKAKDASRKAGDEVLEIDDLYRAANDLASGMSKRDTMLVNAMGEGYEEGVQSILEAVSMGEELDGHQIAESALYGFAGGVGMGLAANVKMPTENERVYAKVKDAYKRQTGETLTTEQVEAMDEKARRTWATMSQVDTKISNQAVETFQEGLKRTATASVPAADRALDALNGILASDLGRATSRTDGAFVVTQLENTGQVDERGELGFGTWPADAVGSSANQILELLRARVAGLEPQLEAVRADLAKAREALRTDPENLDLQETETRRVQQEIDIELMQAAGQQLLPAVERMVTDIHAARDAGERPQVRAGLQQLNSLMQEAFDPSSTFMLNQYQEPTQREAMARVVGVLFARDPHDSSGSYQLLVPQASERLTLEGDDNVLEISHAILPSLRADYDGDKIRPLNQLIVDRDQWVNARSGMHFIGAGQEVNVGTPEYEVHNVKAMADAYASNDIALQGAADVAVNKMKSAFLHRYQGRVDAQVIEKLFADYIRELKAANPKARRVLLDGMSREAGGNITEFARERFSNEWIWMDQVIVSSMQDFQEMFASLHDSYKDDDGNIITVKASSPKQTKRVKAIRERARIHAATNGQAIGQELPGDTMFRKFQKLHYSFFNSSDSGSIGISAHEWVELYAQMGRGVLTAETSRLLDSNAAITAARERLLEMAKDLRKEMAAAGNKVDALTAEVMVINMSVPQIGYDQDGQPFFTGKEISLGQQVLADVVDNITRGREAVLEEFPEVANRFNALRRMTKAVDDGVNAERTMIELLGGEQNFRLFGADALPMGANFTVEQTVRHFHSLGPMGRQQLSRAMKGSPSYLSTGGRPKSMPVRLEDLTGPKGGEYNGYTMMVDAIRAVGASQVTIDPDTGKVTGTMASDAKNRSAEFTGSLQEIDAALQVFEDSEKNDGVVYESRAKALEAYAAQDKTFGSALMNMIPRDQVQYVFQTDAQGNVYPPQWLFDVLTMDDRDAAEMRFHAHIILHGWQAKKALNDTEVDNGSADTKSRAYDRLNSRIHRLFMETHPAIMQDGGLMQQQLMDKLLQAPSVEAFERWLNVDSGLRGDRAPFLLWYDDTAKFDADKGNAGWTSELSGTELREALAALSKATSGLGTSLTEQKAKEAAETAAMNRVLEHYEAQDKGELKPGTAAYDELRRFEAWHKAARETPEALSINVMMQQTIGAVFGVYAQAHTKGANPSHVAPGGEYDAIHGSFDYVTAFERLRNSLTSESLNAIDGNLGVLIRNSGRTMDDYGRPVVWEEPTARDMAEMLKNPLTRDMAKAIFFPQVMDVTASGALTMKMAADASLDRVLKGSFYREMFPDMGGKPSNQQAAVYLESLDAILKESGGHAEVQRLANDLVMSRTSKARQTMSHADIIRATQDAYADVAQALQAVGALDVSEARATELLEALRKDLTSERQKRGNALFRRGKRRSGDTTTTEEATAEEAQVALELIYEAQTSRLDDAAREAAAEVAAATTPEEADAAQALLDEAIADRDRVQEQIEFMQSDNQIQTVARMFLITGDAASQPERRKKLMQYISQNPDLLANSGKSMPLFSRLAQNATAADHLDKLGLSDDDWNEISRVVIGDYVQKNIGGGGLGMTVSPFPSAKQNRDVKYWDADYTYLLEEILRPKGQLFQAAQLMHSRAGLAGEVTMTSGEVGRVLQRTVLNPDKLGPWTSDLPRAIQEAHSRLDSAAAEVAIAMAGNAPKRLATFLGATRRTFEVPTDDMLTTTVLTWDMLNEDDMFSTVSTVSASGRSRESTLASLNNRFAREVKAVLPTGVEVDLLTGLGSDGTQYLDSPDVGRPFVADERAQGSGMYEVSLERMRIALDRITTGFKIPARGMTVTMKFAHPDDQPADPQWYQNLFFEGTVFDQDADHFDSLLGAMWFAPGGISPKAQATALEASKKGKTALTAVTRHQLSVARQAEQNWSVSFTTMLQEKAKTLLTNDQLGDEKLDITSYNAVLKDLKLRHWVRAKAADGKAVLLSAEKVIDAQRRIAEGTASDLGQALGGVTDLSLYVPTEQVLRSMLGEQGGQGVTSRVLLPSELGINPTDVKRFRGDTTTSEFQQFIEGIEGGTATLAQTRIAQRASQRQAVASLLPNSQQITNYDQRIEYENPRKARIHAARGREQAGEVKGLSPRESLDRMLAEASHSLQKDRNSFSFYDMGLSFVGARNPADADATEALLRGLVPGLGDRSEYTRGWIYQEDFSESPRTGVLSRVTLDNPAGDAYQVAPGDMVLIDLGRFENSDAGRERAEVVTRHMAEAGAYVILTDSTGYGEMRMHLSTILTEKLGYSRMAESAHAFAPMDRYGYSQNLAARASSLTEIKAISPRDRVLTFLTSGLPVQEGSVLMRLGQEPMYIGLTRNLVPTGALGKWGLPVKDSKLNQVTPLIHKLKGLDNREGLDLMLKQAGIKDSEESSDFEGAWARMMSRLNDGLVLPKPGTTFQHGDMIPLVHPNGSVVIYRHGYQMPNMELVRDMHNQIKEGSTVPAGVAVYTGKRVGAATIHDGIVREFRNRPGYGLEVVMDVDFQKYGAKLQAELQGLKLLTTPWDDRIHLPNGDIIDGLPIQALTDIDYVTSKEGFGDIINNSRNAFAFFGVDFTETLTEFFFRGKGQDKDSQDQMLTILRRVATQAERIPVLAADEILNGDHFAAELRKYAAAIPGLAELAPTLAKDGQDFETFVASSVLTYLMTPGARVADVLRTGGMQPGAGDRDSVSTLMPPMFTAAFDRLPLGSPLRKQLFEMLNNQIPPTEGREGYVLLEDWRVQTVNSDPAQQLQGWLMFSEMHSSGDDPNVNGMSFRLGEKAGVSYHSASIDYGAMGAETPLPLDPARANAFLADLRRERDDSDDLAQTGGLTRLVLDVDAEKMFSGFRPRTAAEQRAIREQHSAAIAYRQPIDKTDETHWPAKEMEKFQANLDKIQQLLHLQDSQMTMVDAWIRQSLVRPVGKDDDGKDMGLINVWDATSAIESILNNLRDGYVPNFQHDLSALHLEDLQAIFEANQGPGGWAPRKGTSNTADKVETKDWDAWVETVIGQTFGYQTSVDPVVAQALDGYFHSYQGSIDTLLHLPVSRQLLTSAGLLDPESNRLVSTLNKLEAERLARPQIYENIGMSLDQALGGEAIKGRQMVKGRYTSDVGVKTLKRLEKWRKETGQAVPVQMSIQDFRDHGGKFIHTTTTTNALMRTLIDMRATMAMMNPLLYVAMPLEVAHRKVLDRSSSLLSGTATTGKIAWLGAKTSEAVDDTWIGAFLTQSGLKARYTVEEQARFKDLYSTMGQRKDFTSMVYDELVYDYGDNEAALGKIEKFFQKTAKMAGRMQDPTWGVRAHSLARTYVEAVESHLRYTRDTHNITTADLQAGLMRDPQYVKANFPPEAHRAGLNAIAQMRSLKLTIGSAMIRGIIDPLASSPNAAVNIFGNLVLKLPMLFNGYASNVATTLTGMQGAHDFMAMMLHGRKKGFIAKMQRAVLDPADAQEVNETFNMDEILEGLDLTRSFIRGGVTHTGLFAAGLLAGGLGLGGEDEEARKRRLLSEQQGVGVLYDPRDIANDYRNAGAVWVDRIPLLNNFFEVEGTGRSPMMPHWILKQFISPVIGMARFFETGNPREIKWGFLDAINSFPLVNTMLVQDAIETGDQLLQKSEAAAAGGDFSTSTSLLISVAATYERMLFENAFINEMLYVGLDEYDRDSFVIPLTDSDGDIQRDVRGNAREQNLGMEEYIDENGQRKMRYVDRSRISADIATLTEKRGTMAAVASLFTGGTGSDYWRYNMPPKTREIILENLSEDEAAALMLAVVISQGGQKDFAPNEVLKALDWNTNLAEQFAASSRAAYIGPLDKLMTSDLVKNEQARAVIDGLISKTISVDDLATAGISIDGPTREALQHRFYNEFVEEGMMLGLDKQQAGYRANRLMYGQTGVVDSVGVNDFLWSKQISFNNVLTYNQLNTRYVVGPDGFPKATGQMTQTFGALAGMYHGAKGLRGYEGMKLDGRGNIQDIAARVNTGLRALERVDESMYIPTDVEIGKSIEEAIKEAMKGDTTEYRKAGGGFGYGGYRRRGGGGGGGGSSYFTRMNPLMGGMVPYVNDLPNINMSNPIIRRGSIRRERVWSERGRLKQWQ